MAGFLELIDDTLGTHFHTPVYDPKAGRAKLIRQIDLAAKQHKEGTTRAPNRAWAAGNNNAISYSPKVDGKPVLIAGKATNYVPAERFQDFLSGLKASVEAGDLDKEIKAALDGEAAPASTSRGTGSVGGGKTKEPFPKHLHPGYEKLEPQQKRNLGLWWSKGKNPDQTLRSEAGDKPDAKYTPAS